MGGGSVTAWGGTAGRGGGYGGGTTIVTSDAEVATATTSPSYPKAKVSTVGGALGGQTGGGRGEETISAAMAPSEVSSREALALLMLVQSSEVS